MSANTDRLLAYIHQLWAGSHRIPAQLIHFHPVAHLLLLPDLTDDIKDWLANALLPHLADVPDTNAIIFISEAWAVKLPPGAPLDYLPRAREHPDRREIINAMIYTPTSTTMVTWFIDRTTTPPTISPTPTIHKEDIKPPKDDPSTFCNPFAAAHPAPYPN